VQPPVIFLRVASGSDQAGTAAIKSHLATDPSDSVAVELETGASEPKGPHA
jgi:hypothetical protein